MAFSRKLRNRKKQLERDKQERWRRHKRERKRLLRDHLELRKKLRLYLEILGVLLIREFA